MDDQGSSVRPLMGKNNLSVLNQAQIMSYWIKYTLHL